MKNENTNIGLSDANFAEGNRPSARVNGGLSGGKAASPGRLKAWIEAMRLRTLPVSAAGVIMASGLALQVGRFKWLPALICLLFALTAQVGCNFANEFYDYKDGLDRPGRVGPRRGVTEGDITPGAMERAMGLTFLIASLLGCSLIYWGGWWLIPAGIFIMMGALSYSAGPFPLSRNGLGEIAVLIFFGMIPVSLTFWLQAGYYSYRDLFAGIAVGLMSCNILIVNNYRDCEEDAAAGKLTTCVIFGKKAMGWVYLINGIAAAALTWPLWSAVGTWTLLFPTLYLLLHTLLWAFLRSHEGTILTKALGMTAMLMLLFSVAFFCINL